LSLRAILDAAAVAERGASRAGALPAHAAHPRRTRVAAGAAVVRVGAHVDALAATRGLAARALVTCGCTSLAAAGHTRESGVRIEWPTNGNLAGCCRFADANNASVFVARRRRGGLTPLLALRLGDARANSSAGAGIDAVEGRRVGVEAGATTGTLVRAEVRACPAYAALVRWAGIAALAAVVSVAL
jgi:hypothetical protein